MFSLMRFLDRIPFFRINPMPWQDSKNQRKENPAGFLIYRAAGLFSPSLP